LLTAVLVLLALLRLIDNVYNL